jgi:hypothetical protein
LNVHGICHAQTPSKVRVYNARENKGPVLCSQGDLLQISFPFGLSAEEAIGNLRVEIKGKELTEVGVFQVPVIENGGSTPLKKNISAFFKAERAGKLVVTITQLDLNGEARGVPRDFQVVIGKRKPK